MQRRAHVRVERERERETETEGKRERDSVSWRVLFHWCVLSVDELFTTVKTNRTCKSVIERIDPDL